MSKKYQIFVSSTFLDLREEREQIIKASLEMGHIPVGMEMFSASDEEQWKIIQRQIDEIDYYIILIAHRYGSTTEEGISYTEKEYDYAVSKGIPVLGFVIEDTASWPANKIDNDEANKISLLNFKEKIKSKLVNFWSNKDELHAKFSIALMKAIVNNPRSGWVRSEEVIGADIMKELSRLSSENSTLREENINLKAIKRETEKEHKDIINILVKNNRPLYIWYKEDTDWTKDAGKEVSLLQIFQAIAPDLLVENDNENIAKDIALNLCDGNPYRDSWPVPKNHISHWMTDFHALELAEPSKKKHTASDKNNYWTLTKKGRDIIGSLRKLSLMAGIKEKEEAPDNG